jgi:hypothetical protein
MAVHRLNPFWRWVYLKFGTSSKVDLDFHLVWGSKREEEEGEGAEGAGGGGGSGRGQHHEVRWWEVVVHPASSFRTYWDSLVILLILYTIIVVPFR